MRARRSAILFAALFLVGAACSREPPAGPSPTRTPTPHPTEVVSGPNSSAEALAALCPDIKPPGPVQATASPESVQSAGSMVEKARHLDFLRPVATEIVTAAQMQKNLAELTGRPAELAYLADRGRALAAMGAIPAGVDLGKAIQDFVAGQVLGYYDPDSDALVLQGKKHLSALDRFSLAHELVHAIDDQNFDLSRLSDLDRHCQDDAGTAARALAEGSATLYSIQVVLESFTALDKAAVVREGLDLAGEMSVPESVPPFVTRTEEWSYTAGLRFVQFLRGRGGDAAVNAAFRSPPVSTEQVIHPVKYPGDLPQGLDIPDLGPELGPTWKDLDVGQVGEEWLAIYLGLRLEVPQAQVAAAGWDGGIYRAWTDGNRVAVVLSTVWDTPGDANQFGSAMKDWLAGSPVDAEIVHAGDGVQVLFGSDAAALDALQQASVSLH